MRRLKYISICIVILIVWTGLVNLATLSGILLHPIAKDSSPAAFIEASKKALEKEFVGNLAMILIEDGEATDDMYYSIDKPINHRTIFQMASVSKWLTAWGVWSLVEDGRLDLDQSVEHYLTRWHLPESEFNNQDVTIRNLLSHTSGLTDGLGYAGFASADSVQTIEASLTKAADAFWSDGIVRVGYAPNSRYQYSGGGYTLLQLVIEEISGQSFNAFMKESVFEPLGMYNTSFYWSDTSSLEIARFYDTDTMITPHYIYTALAAASCYSNIEDMTLFLKANVSKNPVLKEETVKLMYAAGNLKGQGTHGLGPMVFGKNGAGDFIIGHDGISRPAINTAARINLHTKDGIIVLNTGNWSFASSTADHWAYWKTKIPNNTIMASGFKGIIALLVVGYLLILLTTIYIYKRRGLHKAM